MKMLYRSTAHMGRIKTTIKRADVEVVQINGLQREEKGDNEESGCRGYTDQGSSRGRKRVTVKRADAEAIQLKGPHKEEKGNNKASGRRGCADQGAAEGGKKRQ